MKPLLIVILICLVRFSFGQSEAEFAELHPYSRYVHCSFEHNFDPAEKALKHLASKSEFPEYNLISVVFNADSSYIIHMELLESTDNSVSAGIYDFRGSFKLDGSTVISLNGDHPFTTNIINVKEKNGKEEVRISGFKVKLNEVFSWTSKKKLTLFCDGSCTLSKGE